MYTRELEQLDVRRGRVHTIKDWRAAGEKSAADLTPDDFIIIEGFEGVAAADHARKRHAAAQRVYRKDMLADSHLVTGTDPQRVASSAPRAPRDLVSLTSRADLDIILGEVFGVLQAVVARLDARIDQLEAKPHVTFCGVWRQEQTYQRGDATTRNGSLWICTTPTTAGTPWNFHCWQLAVKQGRAHG